MEKSVGILRRAEAGAEEYTRAFLARDKRISLGRRKRERDRFRGGMFKDEGKDHSG